MGQNNPNKTTPASLIQRVKRDQFHTTVDAPVTIVLQFTIEQLKYVLTLLHALLHSKITQAVVQNLWTVDSYFFKYYAALVERIIKGISEQGKGEILVHDIQISILQEALQFAETTIFKALRIELIDLLLVNVYTQMKPIGRAEVANIPAIKEIHAEKDKESLLRSCYSDKIFGGHEIIMDFYDSEEQRFDLQAAIAVLGPPIIKNGDWGTTYCWKDVMGEVYMPFETLKGGDKVDTGSKEVY